jgi:hypothetical protein
LIGRCVVVVVSAVKSRVPTAMLKTVVGRGLHGSDTREDMGAQRWA